MKRTTLAMMVVLLGGCSGEDEPEPCSLSHRDGAYVQTFRERSGGSCGPLQDQVVILDAKAMTANSGVPLDCALDADDQISADQCKVTRAYTCAIPTGSVSFVGLAEEQDGGARITGTVTTTLFDASGALKCRSTYDVTYTRQ
jgi:hypothetical protein